MTRRMFDQVQLDGNRGCYRFLLSVCRLLHDLLLVDERTGEHRIAGLTDARMSKLYEDFVIEFYRRAQDRFEVNRRGRAGGIATVPSRTSGRNCLEWRRT